MKAFYRTEYGQLLIQTDTIRPDGEPYFLSVVCGTPEEANRILADLGYEPIHHADVFIALEPANPYLY